MVFIKSILWRRITKRTWVGTTSMSFYRRLSISFPVLTSGIDIHWKSTSGSNYVEVCASSKQGRDPLQISVEERENNWDCRRETGLDLHSFWRGRSRCYGFRWGRPDCPRTIQVIQQHHHCHCCCYCCCCCCCRCCCCRHCRCPDYPLAIQLSLFLSSLSLSLFSYKSSGLKDINHCCHHPAQDGRNPRGRWDASLLCRRCSSFHRPRRWRRYHQRRVRQKCSQKRLHVKTFEVWLQNM